MKVITNNPIVRDKLSEDYEIDYKEESLGDCLNRIKSAVVDDRLLLLTHPMSGSIKPNETVYKSVVVMKSHQSDDVDLNSLRWIERAISVYDRFQDMHKTPDWPENVLDDFAAIDYDIIKSALERIQVPPLYL